MRRIKRKVGGIKYLPVLLILLSVTIMVGSTFAYFTDKKEDTSDLTFSKVELSSETTVGIDGKLRDVIPGTKLVDGAVSFSKSIDSEAIYVRAKISFSMPREFALDSDMQAFIKELRNATDFNIISSEQHGAVWSERDGNYFYLVSSIDNTKLMRVDTIDTFTLSNEVVVPRDLKNLPDNAQYMKSINFHIAFEAIQADNVSDILSETKITFDTLFPTPADEKAGIYVSIMNNDLMSVKQEIMLTEAKVIEEPEAEDIVVDGTTTHIFDGWYSDAGLTEKFDFTKKVTTSVSLYPKYLEVSEGLVFTEVYETETATASESPAAIGDVIGYSVAQGSCTDTRIILPLEYNGKPILEITENGFRYNSDLTYIYLPDTITKINVQAFYKCYNLDVDKLPNDLQLVNTYAFGECKNLTFPELPSGATQFGRYAFVNCSKLAITSLPNGITRVENGVFQGCSLLAITEFPESLTVYCENAFDGCVNLSLTKLPDNITGLGTNAFAGCKKLALTKLPSKLQSIKRSTFSGCTNLQFTELPSGLADILDTAFKNCTGFTMLKLPSSLRSVGVNVFNGCTNLNYLLCETQAVGLLVQDKGVDNSKIYVKGSEAPSVSEFTAVEGLDIATGTDSDGKLWVRVGDSDYTYYKQLVTYNVTFKASNLTSNYKIEKIIDGTLVSEPAAPTHSDPNAQFDGWYRDSEFTTKFDFNTAITFDLNLYPKFNLGFTLTVMDFGNSDVAYTSQVGVGETVDGVNLQTEDENGTTTFILDGWYIDSEFTTPFVFGSEISENTTLYNKGLIVSSNLEYTALYENANDTTEITSYSVAKGTCVDSEIVLPNKYLGKNITSITASGFSATSTLTSIYLPETITKFEANAFYNCGALALTSLPSGVTSIGNYAFSGCGSLALTSLPDSVTSIGNYAFQACRNIEWTSLPSGITSIGAYTFSGCSKLALTELPSGVTSIGTYAFQDCTLLALTSLPSGVATINNSVFFGCTSLALTSLPSGVTSIGTYAFYNCTTLALTSLPTGITSIGNSAFQNCSSLALTSLPSGVKTIGRYVFQNCSSLALTSLPTNLTSIGNYAFQNCTSLALTSLPTKVKTISDNAFNGCSKLALTTLPSSLTTIGWGAFYGCSKLALTSIPSSVTSIGDSAFYDCVLLPNNGSVYYLKIGSTSTYNVVQAVSTSLTTIQWPSNVVTISAAFNKCANLVNVSIPSTVTVIGESSFYECTSLESVTMPSNVTEIGDWAFYGCSSLKSITIPSKVTYLGDYSFYECKSLTEINFNATELDDLYSGNGIFYCAGQNTAGITVNIGANVTVVPSYLFRPDSMLTSTNAPNIIKVNFESGSVCEIIGFYAFANCTGITSIELPSMVNYIGYDAFYGCTGLEFVSLPSTVTTVGSDIFSGCTALKYVLCASSSVATSVTGKGVDNTCIYALQSSGYSGITETAVVISDTLTIYTATDASGNNWVRNGSKYFKAIA